jgi:hypothetical protein
MARLVSTAVTSPVPNGRPLDGWNSVVGQRVIRNAYWSIETVLWLWFTPKI